MNLFNFGSKKTLTLSQEIVLALSKYLEEEGFSGRTTEEAYGEIAKHSSLSYSREVERLTRKSHNSSFYEKLSQKSGDFAVYDYLKSRSHQANRDNVEQAIIMMELEVQDSILDAGCGTGLEAVFLAGLLKKGKVTGIDSSSGLAERAKERAIRRNVQNTEFKQGKLEAIPYSDNTFNGVICVNTLYEGFSQMYFEEMNKCLGIRIGQMDRVLKQGGKLFLTIPNQGRNREIQGNIDFQKTILRTNFEAGGYSNFKFNNITRVNKEGSDFNHSYICLTKG